MNKYAIIENGKVINTVLSEHDYALEQGWIACPDEVGIEWDYVNGQFSDARSIEPPLPSPTKEQLLAKIQALIEKVNSLS